ncbi:MAG: hypothetical protein H6618_05720 [Deltaproteobacteria bacterium]|nr:hypothetical protein [Deltaproteobacteria bacterium]
MSCKKLLFFALILIFFISSCKTKSKYPTTQKDVLIEEYSVQGADFVKITSLNPEVFFRINVCAKTEADNCRSYTSVSEFKTEGIPKGEYNASILKCNFSEQKKCTQIENFPFSVDYRSDHQEILSQFRLNLNDSKNSDILNLYTSYKNYSDDIISCSSDDSPSHEVVQSIRNEILNQPFHFFQQLNDDLFKARKDHEGFGLTDANGASSTEKSQKYGVRIIIWEPRAGNKLLNLTGHAALQIYRKTAKGDEEVRYLSWAMGNDFESDAAWMKVLSATELPEINETQLSNFTRWFDQSLIGNTETLTDAKDLRKKIQNKWPQMNIDSIIRGRKGVFDFPLPNTKITDPIAFKTLQGELEGLYVLENKLISYERRMEIKEEIRKIFGDRYDSYDPLIYRKFVKDMIKKEKPELYKKYKNDFENLKKYRPRLLYGAQYNVLSFNCAQTTKICVKNLYSDDTATNGQKIASQKSEIRTLPRDMEREARKNFDGTKNLSGANAMVMKNSIGYTENRGFWEKMASFSGSTSLSSGGRVSVRIRLSDNLSESETACLDSVSQDFSEVESLLLEKLEYARQQEKITGEAS